MEGDAAVWEAARLMATSYSIHFHVWIPEDITELLEYLRTTGGVPWVTLEEVDNTGSDEGNMKLSQERSNAIKTLLVSKGIAPERIVAKGYGSQYPQVANDTPAGRQANRRVEIVVLNEGVSPQSVTR